MSMLSNLLHKVFGTSAQAAEPSASPAAPEASSRGPASAPAGAPTSGAAPAQAVDLAAILDAAVAKKKEKLAWRTSIVDLMKALDLDSSLSARKELAKDLHYTGDTNDSATMNIWLHKQVMQKVAANGGKVPEDLKA